MEDNNIMIMCLIISDSDLCDAKSFEFYTTTAVRDIITPPPTPPANIVVE